MKITKKLKYAEFEYDEESKQFLIVDPENGNAVELNKVYAFAFMRFVIRMAQRNWFRQIKKVDKSLDKDTSVDVCLKQMNFIEEDQDIEQDTLSSLAYDSSNEPF